MLGIVAGLVALSAGSQMAPAAEKVQRPDTQAPFAIQDVPPDYDPHFNGLGVRWVRLSGAAGAVWDADEPTPGTFEWQRLDSIIGGYSRRGMNMLVTVLSFNRWDRGLPPGANAAVPLPVDLPHNMDAYKSYLRALVLRYPAVRYWQIENEPDGNGWKDTPERFAILVKESYLTIKQANPEARVVLAGAALPEGFYRFYLPMLAALSGMKDAPDSRYFDVADIHWSGQFGGNYRMHTPTAGRLAEFLPDLAVKLSASGYDNMPVWITEMSNYDGLPAPEPLGNGDTYVFLRHSELKHAAEVIKSNIFPPAHGVSKVFWVRLDEWPNYCGPGGNCYWDNTGLINNPQNDGQRHKKLAYYAYKLMVEKLAEADWRSIETVWESDDCFVYKLNRNNGPVWAAWNDNVQEKQITITGIPSHQVTITEAIPGVDSGKDVVSYHAAFSKRNIPVKGGAVSFVLKERPVYVEVKN